MEQGKSSSGTGDTYVDNTSVVFIVDKAATDEDTAANDVDSDVFDVDRRVDLNVDKNSESLQTRSKDESSRMQRKEHTNADTKPVDAEGGTNVDGVDIIEIEVCDVDTGYVDPPIRPKTECSYMQKMEYIDHGIFWLTNELRSLQDEDKYLVKKFTTMIKSAEQLKKVDKTFTEQREILEDLEEHMAEKGQYKSSHLIDRPSNIGGEMSRIPQRKVSNLQRYTRVGIGGRRASHY